MDSNLSPCLVAENGKYRNIYFDRDEVTVGRSLETTVCLPSAVISRNHATIKKMGQQWYIMDNDSLNGVFVNDVKVTSSHRTPLTDGDKVSFGMKRGDEDYVYTFHNRSERASKRKDFDKGAPYGSFAKKAKTSQLQELMEKKRQLEKKVNHLEMWIAERVNVEKNLEEEIISEKHMSNMIYQRLTDILDMLSYKQDHRKHQRDVLEDRVNMHHNQWLDEKNRVDLLLNKTLPESKLCTLMSRKHILDKLLSTRGVDRQLLDEASCSGKQPNSAEDAKQSLLKELNEIVESELQCCICSELFVEATTLNCSHTFCRKCIEDWMAKVKRNPDCPFCRTRIMMHVKSCALDSFIDRVVESFSPEQKERRKQLVKERTAVCKKPHRRSSEYVGYWSPRVRRHSEFLHLPGNVLDYYHPNLLVDSD